MSQRNSTDCSRITAARLACPSKATCTPGVPAPTRCSYSFLPVMVSQEYAMSLLTTTSVFPSGLSAAAVGRARSPSGHFQNAVCRREGVS